MNAQHNAPRQRTSRKGAAQEPVQSSLPSRGAKSPDSNRVRVDDATRYNLIARAAYLRAEKRGFAPGGEQQDWLEAEAEIDRLLKS
jgi:hypothetical protein